MTPKSMKIRTKKGLNLKKFENVQKLVDKAKRDDTILAVAFFGSYARGDAYHDVDVCLFLYPRHYSAAELSEKKLDYSLDNEKYDIQVFQQLPLYIQIRILHDAKFMFIRDEDVLYDVCFSTQREWEHFKPIYDSYLEAVESG
jgi:predicted nucleotidyltransferase